MSKAQLVITAVVLEGRSKSEVARDYDLSRQWVHQLVTRYKTDGPGPAMAVRRRREEHGPRRPDGPRSAQSRACCVRRVG
jgi:transposase